MELLHLFLNLEGNKIFQIKSKGDVIPFDTLIQKNNKLALIDRDGVICEKAKKHEYLISPEKVIILNGVGESIRYLNEKAIPVVIITNQPCIYKKILDYKGFYEINLKIQNELEKYNAHLDLVLFCPHGSPEKEGNLEKFCGCRKPKPGMVNLALKLFDANKRNTFLFGDFESDVLAAENSGVNPVWIATKHDEYKSMRNKINLNHPEIYKNSQFPTLFNAIKVFQKN